MPSARLETTYILTEYEVWKRCLQFLITHAKLHLNNTHWACHQERGKAKKGKGI